MPIKDPKKRAEYQKKASQIYYENNKERIKKQSLEAKTRFKARWGAYKSSLICTKCGESHPATLDFHHIIRHPSNVKVYYLVRKQSWKLLMLEIAKCLVLCANCHRKHHWEEEQERKVRRTRKRKKHT